MKSIFVLMFAVFIVSVMSEQAADKGGCSFELYIFPFFVPTALSTNYEIQELLIRRQSAYSKRHTARHIMIWLTDNGFSKAILRKWICFCGH